MRDRLGSAKLRRWNKTVGRIFPIWLSGTALSSGTACLSLALLHEQALGHSIDFISLWNVGIGAVSIDSMLSLPQQATGSSTILGVSTLTNIPQVVLSMLFFTYTYILTTMVACSKCTNASATAKQLAEPARSLPLYCTFLIGAYFTVVHWMASQAFFPVSVQDSGEVNNDLYLSIRDLEVVSNDNE
ncbi:MAG: hypothetical protein MMC33_009703, partial [Icmadophila ericetorum]|nr:hypothetical protein [Icmadophila ericetorum]